MFDTNTMESILEGAYGPEDHSLKILAADTKKATAPSATQARQKKDHLRQSRRSATYARATPG